MTSTAPDHAAIAAQLHSARRARDTVFGEDRMGFGEPGWDILLAMFAHSVDGYGMTKSAAIGASGVQADVALRYLEWLVSRDLVVETGGCVSMSDRGRLLMTTFLDRHEKG